MKKLLIILLLFFCIIGYAYGGENTTNYDDAPRIINEDHTKTVTALEDGHLNTSFSNNHKGYCVEYTEQEAHKGDQFISAHTSHIRNNRTGEDVSQYLKRYFIDHYNETQKDPIITQHTIWHFTDDFEGWRLNKTLIKEIRESTHKYNDTGTRQWNSTHLMKYSFQALLSPYEHHQNYFTYLITFEPVPNETVQNTTPPIIDVENNKSNNTSSIIIKNCTYSEEEPKHLNTIKHITLQTEKTGTPTGLIILAIISIPILTYRKQ